MIISRSHHSRNRAYSGHFIVLAMFAVLLCLPPSARAELIFGAEVRITSESNVVGLLTGGTGPSGSPGGVPMMSGAMTQAAGRGFGGGMGGGSGGSSSYTGGGSQQVSDLSMTVAAELGGETRRDAPYSFFAKGFAERTDYQEYSLYDQSVGGVSAGVTARPGEVLWARLAGTGWVERFDNDPDRNGTGQGGAVTLKQFLHRRFYVREAAEYETYRASNQSFSYRGMTYRCGAGTDITERTLLFAGYRYQSRYYQDPAATALRTGTAAIGADHTLTARWSTGLTAEREVTWSGAFDTVTRNNILSLVLRYSY